MIKASDATTPMMEFRLALQNASRFNFDSSSHKNLRKLMRNSDLLDELEKVLDHYYTIRESKYWVMTPIDEQQIYD